MENETLPGGHIERKSFEHYQLFPVEKSRPPSRGGNTGALHSHALTIDGERYSFLALGSQQWAYKSDTVSFDYEIRDGYKNVIATSFMVFDKSGKLIKRGNHGFKPVLRTASARMPASRREQRD